MDNIEPLWVFMRRFGMNLRATKISIANYPVALPTHVQELVRKVQSYEVSRATIESFTFMSRNNSLLGNLDNKQLNEWIQISANEMFLTVNLCWFVSTKLL